MLTPTFQPQGRIMPEENIIIKEVENTYRNEKAPIIEVKASVRGSLIEFWFHKKNKDGKKTIDGSQYEAANTFMYLVHRLRGSGASAIDLTKPIIDYSYSPENYDRWPQSREDARKQLDKVRERIGPKGMERLESVVCNGHGLRDSAAKFGYYSTEEIRTYSGIIRDYLTQLVDLWGLVAEGRSAK